MDQQDSANVVGDGTEIPTIWGEESPLRQSLAVSEGTPHIDGRHGRFGKPLFLGTVFARNADAKECSESKRGHVAGHLNKGVVL